MTVLVDMSDLTRRLLELLSDDISVILTKIYFIVSEEIPKSCCHVTAEFHKMTQKILVHLVKTSALMLM